MSKTWDKCLTTLEQTLPLQTFSLWVKPINVIERLDDISLLAPDQESFDYINQNLKKEIKNAITRHNKKLKIFIAINKKKSSIKNTSHNKYSTPLTDDYTFDNLVTGDANQVAYTSAINIANNIDNSTYSPFILYGASGLGKTHLMQSVGHFVKKKTRNTRVVYSPLINFVKNITSSLRHNNIEELKDFYNSADLLLIDDIHLISGKEKSQEELFHILDFLFNNKKQIILTCDQQPRSIKKTETRLLTRLSQGLTLELTKPELEMRAAILLKKATSEKINIKLSEDVALFIASNISSNVRDLEGALLKLKAFIHFSNKENNDISIEFVKNALSDLLKPKLTSIDINDIQKETAKHYSITVSDLSSKSRKQNIVLARQMAIFIAYELTNLSLKKIGNNFGKRDHTTIMHSLNKIKKTLTDETIKKDYELIKLKITSV
jgi:chromosomal replication initiator protein